MVEYRKIITKLLEMDNPRRSYSMIEALILNVLTKHIKEQNREFYSNFRFNTSHKSFASYIEFDGYAPHGFDDYVGETVIEIKIYNIKQSIRRALTHGVVDRILQSGKNIKNIIFLFTLDLTEDEKNDFIQQACRENINIFIWDMKKIEGLFNQYRDYVDEISENLPALMIDTTISKSINNNENEWKKRRDEYLINLRNSYYEDDLVMFLGAGISKDAKIASWDQLISDLIVSLISRKMEDHDIKLSELEKELIISKIKSMNGNSPLLQVRYVRTGLENAFTEILTKILYKNCINTSEILTEIAQLCLPVRNGTGIQGVVTYNFDDLIEYNFQKFRIKHRSVYREGEMPSKNELGVFHVHGFLPRDSNKYENLSKELLVFSEEGYHNLVLDPYNWANIIQLNYLRENTCLFIGLSMTDPNLRRLLDIAARKHGSDTPSKHYAILKRDVFSKEIDDINNNINVNSIKRFDMANQDLQEEFFKELGINIIWIDDYSEIPSILKQVKE